MGPPDHPTRKRQSHAFRKTPSTEGRCLRREQDIPGDTPDEPGAAWREAQVLPILDASLDQLAEKDRSLVIQRFFERKRFAEIAGTTGKSEAACKMQLKRALEKLAILLRSRGIALSVPVIATGLSAEFAKAAPLASQPSPPRPSPHPAASPPPPSSPTRSSP
jgi:hypothetical protein